jgi:trans-aconitate methyltransferase
MTKDFDGEKYKKASAHQKEWGEKLIAELSLKGNEKILDLGCGDGKITTRLAELVPSGSVIGIDSSESMITTAEKDHKAENLVFMQEDINDMRYENEFHVIFSNATLHWVKDHNKLMENVSRALKADGMLRFQFAGHDNCSHLYKVLEEVMSMDQYAGYFKEFEWPWYMPAVDEYEKLMEDFAFKEKKVWEENADRYFPDARAMTRWIDQPSLVPFLKWIHGEHKQAFRDLVVQRMIEMCRQKDGTCFETFRRINVFARK